MNLLAKTSVGLRRWHAIVLSCLLLMMGASTTFAAEFVFSRGAAVPELGISSYDGYADVRLNESFADNGAGLGQIFAGDAGNAAVNRALMRWDLSSLAPGTILGDATLTMRISNLSQDDGFETVDGADFFDFHRIVDTNAGWLEDMNNNVTAGPAVDLEPSWNNFSQTPPQTWVNSGGTGDFPGLGSAGDGYNTTPAFTLNQASYLTGDDVQITVPQAVIEDIVAGGASHPGFLLRARDEFFAGRIGFSSDASLHSLTIDVDIPVQVAELEVDRTTGAMTLTNNTGSPIDFKSYSITSVVGGLDAAEWTRIVDADSWTDLSATTSELSEEENPFVDGKQLAAGGVGLSLGNAWIQSPDEDLQMELALNDNSTQTVFVRFVGNGDQPFEIGDLNFSGSVTEADWPIYRDGFDQDLSALSQAEAYGMGDLNNDGVNDHADFVLFRSAFDANMGAGAFNAMLSNVPEPSSVALILIGSSVMFVGRHRRKDLTIDRVEKKMPSRCKHLLIAIFSCFTMLSLGDVAPAQVLIDDHFDNGDIATGGTNGGFAVVTNGGLGGGNPAGTVVEAGTNATITTGSPFNHDGLSSVNSFDSTAVTGLAATLEVTSISSDPWANGLFFGITDDNTSFYRTQSNFGLLLSDANFGLSELAFMANDGGGTGGAPATILASATYDLPSLLDGFTASFSADQTGWSYEISGVTVGSVATTLSDSGLYPAGFTYAGQFNTSNHLTTSVQRGPESQGPITLDIDRLTIEVPVEPDLPTLQVSTTTGAAMLLNDTATTFDIEFYEITSANDALDPVGWNSFEEQDLEGSGPPNNTGDGWEVLGTPRDGKIAESYLQGSLMLGNGDDETLGNPFDTSVFGSGVDGDLVFKVGLTDDSLLIANVVYVSTTQPGDFDFDGDVDGVDFLEWQRSVRTQGGLADWQSNYGLGASSASAAATVPEPSSAMLLLSFVVTTSRARRRTANR